MQGRHVGAALPSAEGVMQPIDVEMNDVKTIDVPNYLFQHDEAAYDQIR
jgi:hypothetical protein